MTAMSSADFDSDLVGAGSHAEAKSRRHQSTGKQIQGIDTRVTNNGPAYDRAHLATRRHS